MKGQTAYEAIANVSDILLIEAAEILNLASPTAAIRPAKKENRFSRLANSGWGVAILCAVVSLSVLTAVIWAGLRPPAGGPVGTDGETTDSILPPTETPDEEETDREIISMSLSDFSEVDLSLFKTDQSALSVTNEGHLLISAAWRYGDYATAQFSYRPEDLMPYSPGYEGYDQFSIYTPGAILFKYKREGVTTEELHSFFLGPHQSEGEAGYAQIILQRNPETGYEYLLVRTDTLPTFMNRDQPIMTMHWAHLGSAQAYPDGVFMRLEEVVFYQTSEDALYDFPRYLEADHYVADLNYTGNAEDVCLVTKNPLYSLSFLNIPSRAPDGRAVREILRDAFMDNVFITRLRVGEGVEYIRPSAFYRCENLRTAALPESLISLEDDAFNRCTALTEIHLGKGLRLIGHWALPLDSAAFTDIYYSGTIRQWYSIIRIDETADHAITVHCSDGDIDYSAPAPDFPPEINEGEDREMAEFLATAEPIHLKSGETLIDVKARVIRLKTGYEESMDVVLRYGLALKDDLYRYCFDILSLEDGSILAAPSSLHADYLSLPQELGGMIYVEESVTGDLDPMIFFYNYGLDEENNLRYRTQYYGIRYEAEGYIRLLEDYHLSPGLNASTYIPYRTKANRHLRTTINSVRLLIHDLTDERAGCETRVLISTAPGQRTTVFSSSRSPAFSVENLEAVSQLTLSEIVKQGLPSLYTQYGPKSSG